MSALLALQIVVTAICCAFYRCGCFPLHIACKRPRLTFPNSRAVVGESGMYCRPEAYLGWRVLAFGHVALHSLGMTVASVAFASATDRTVPIARFSCQPFYPIALGQNAQPMEVDAS
jgi:hypothetical protein